jgi:aspartate/methionine/tyrosine aminotransferase
MLDRTALRGLVEYCAERRMRLISDEIYHGITYGEPAETAVAFSDATIVVNSFSKYYSMTGWRLGWAVLPDPLLRAVECLAQNLFISPPGLSQLAATHVFDCFEELEANVARYATNRALLLDGLPRAGFERLAPADGAFYLYAQLADADPDSVELTHRMLVEADLAATPGIDFDPERGDRFVRFCFAGAPDEMAEAVRRLVAWRG